MKSIRGAQIFYILKNRSRTVYLFGELHKPSTCDPNSTPIEHYIEGLMTRYTTLFLEGHKDSLSSIPPEHQSGVYNSILYFQGKPNVELVDIRAKVIPYYSSFEKLHSIYKYLVKKPHKSRYVRDKEQSTFETILFVKYISYFSKIPTMPVSFENIDTALLSDDPQVIKDVYAFLNMLRDAFSYVMDSYVERLFSLSMNDIIYLAGTHHIDVFRKRLLKKGYTEISKIETFSDKDCLVI
jgi:hypothetical protein